VLLLVKPAGTYMARVFNGDQTVLDPVLKPIERIIYRVCGVIPKQDMVWTEYAYCFLLFSLFGTLLLYALLRFQTHLPFSDPVHLTSPITPDLAANTAVSFSTTTTWQAYGGETTNSGPHGFSEIMFAYTSCLANNGQAFGGLNSNIPFYNFTTIIAMMVGRFFLAIPALALAGRFANQGRRAVTIGTLQTDTALFGTVIAGTALIVGLLSYFPALALGPIIEHYFMWR
jgi:K+-transporting ATPase A subunit